MPDIRRSFSGKAAPFPSYIDLNFCQDDETVLKNPHKGWYWHYIDNGVDRPVPRMASPAGGSCRTERD